MEYHRQYAPATVRNDPVYAMVLQSVRQEFIPRDKIIPLTLGAVEKYPDFPKDRSPGLPWKGKGYKTKGDVLADPVACATWHRKWRNIGRGRSETLPDVALFVRAQVTGIDREKVRAVWGYPIDVIVEDGRSFYPYLSWLKKTSAPIGYCVEVATGGMSYINDMLTAHPDAKYLITDWSCFDKTVPPWLIRDAFQIVYDSMDWSHVKDSEGKVWVGQPQRLLLNATRFNFLNFCFLSGTPGNGLAGLKVQKNLQERKRDAQHRCTKVGANQNH